MYQKLKIMSRPSESALDPAFRLRIGGAFWLSSLSMLRNAETIKRPLNPLFIVDALSLTSTTTLLHLPTT